MYFHSHVITVILSFFLTALTIVPSLAQTPQQINYQAVARNSSGEVMDGATIDVTFAIQDASANTVYSESHSGVQTNQYGLFTLAIGSGTVQSGSFAAIDWSASEYDLAVEVDGNPMGTSDLNSVPYSLHSQTADTANIATMPLGQLSNVSAVSAGNGQVLTWDGSAWVAEDESVADADADPTNEYQVLSISGTTLSISDGNSITLPGDDWGGQTAQTDSGLSGSGTSANPLSVNWADASDLDASGSVQNSDMLDSEDGTYYLDWNNFTNIPTDLADGDDTATYAGGTGIGVSGATINAQNGSAIWNASQLQGSAVSSASPGNGEVLKWDGTSWAPAADSSSDEDWTVNGNDVFNETDSIGIHTNNPKTALHVGSGQAVLYGNSMSEPQGAVAFWNPAKSAFRAGEVTNDNWDADSIGNQSFAIGTNTKATGTQSTAMGVNTTASGSHSTSMGLNSIASGNESIAMGDNTDAIGNTSTAMGDNTTASGSYSTAMGRQTTASGNSSMAMGENVTASGTRSTALGINTTASGDNTTAIGINTEARQPNSLSIGEYNSANTNVDGTLFVVGNGSILNGRSDALVLDVNGNLTIAGSLTQNSDRRLKESIQPLQAEVMDSLMTINPVYYHFKDSTGHPEGEQLGLIAQEVQKHFPKLVRKGTDDYLSLSYSKLTTVLLKGMQEQQKENEQIRKENERLLERVQHLEQKQENTVELQSQMDQLKQQVQALQKAVKEERMKAQQ